MFSCSLIRVMETDFEFFLLKYHCFILVCNSRKGVNYAFDIELEN